MRLSSLKSASLPLSDVFICFLYIPMNLFLSKKVIIHNGKFVQTMPNKAVQIQMTHEQHH